MACTSISAFWCPVHGDCTCARLPDGDCMFDGENCPLHDGKSTHAETIERAEVELHLDEVAERCGVALNENDRAELARFGQYLYERSRKRKTEKEQ